MSSMSSRGTPRSPGRLVLVPYRRPPRGFEGGLRRRTSSPSAPYLSPPRSLLGAVRSVDRGAVTRYARPIV